MAQRAIREADGKRMMANLLKEYTDGKYTLDDKVISIGPGTDLKRLPVTYKWLTSERLVAKPDVLIKRRGKSKLLMLDANWKDVEKWIEERMGKPLTVGNATGVLDHFIVEPFIPHNQSDEYYLAIISEREGDQILFHHEGGMSVGDIDAKALRLMIPTDTQPTTGQIEKELLSNVLKERRSLIAGFIEGVFKFYADLNYG